MKSSDKLEFEGQVVECLPDTQFRIKLFGNQGESLILGYLSGSMRKNRIKVLLGDRVLIELTPYDLTRGRVVRRLHSQPSINTRTT